MKIRNYKFSIFVSLFFNVISKGLLFLVNIFIAYYFGANISTDIYFFLLSIILMTSNFLLGITGSVVIPEFMRREVEESMLAAQAFVNRTIMYIILILSIIAVLIFIWPVYLFSWVSSFHKEVLQDHIDLIRPALVVLVLQSIVTLLNEVLVSRKYFILPAIIAISNSVLTIVCVAMFYDSYGLKSIFFANITALILSIVAQALILMRFEKWAFDASSFQRVRRTNYDFFYACLSIVASTISAFFPIYLLSQFTGVLTEFNYSQRISEIPNSLLAIQFASVAAIRFNELYSRGEVSEMNVNFGKSAKTLLFALVPISILVYCYSKEIASLLFYSSALDDRSLQNISSFISVLILATPFVGLSYVTTRVMMAVRKVKESVFFQLTMTVINGLFVVAGVYLIGPSGYMLGYVCYQILYSLSLYWVLRKLLPFINYTFILKYIVVLLVYCTPLIFMTILLTNSIQHLVSSLVLVLIATGSFAVLLLLINQWLRINEEIAQLSQQISGKLVYFMKNNFFVKCGQK